MVRTFQCFGSNYALRKSSFCRSLLNFCPKHLNHMISIRPLSTCISRACCHIKTLPLSSEIACNYLPDLAATISRPCLTPPPDLAYHHIQRPPLSSRVREVFRRVYMEMWRPGGLQMCMCGGMEVWRSADVCTWKCGDREVCRCVCMEIWSSADGSACRRRGLELCRRVYMEA